MPKEGLVRSVVVSPGSIALQVGSTLALGASVVADASVTIRTVSWSSSDSSIAKVNASGIVTAVGAGTTTIVATATADPTVKGMATVTVTPAPPPPVPTIGIVGATTTSCSGSQCSEVPADLQNFGTGSALPGATGQLIVSLAIDTKGLSIKSYGASLKCGLDSVTTVQTSIGSTKLTLVTTAFDAATGVPAAHNGSCALTASLAPTTGATQTTPPQSVVLNNADGAVVTTATTGPASTDVSGLSWESGSVTLSALPVLYSRRRPASIQFILPNAKGQAQLVKAAASGATTATWPNSSTSIVSVAQITLAGIDASGFPATVHPSVLAIDSTGVASALPQLNPAVQSDLRLDNQAPQPPLSFQIPQSQSSWVNASYSFAGAGPSAAAADARYISCGDAPAAPLTIAAPANPQPPCATPQSGVSASGQFISGLNGQTALAFYFVSAATYASQSLQVSPTGTSDVPADCDVSKWKKIAKAGDITPASSPNNQQYVVRAVETDKLGNARCADLSAAVGMINTPSGGFVPGKFGVDVVTPVANLVDGDVTAVSAKDVCPFFVAGVQQVPSVNLACGSGATIKSFKISASDDASGFSAAPVATTLRRLSVAGNGQANACIIGSGAACDAVPRPLQTIAADANTSGASSGIDGYYTLTATISDVALNVAPALIRSTLVDRSAPVMGGVSVPATLVGGTNVQFAASVSDNVDLATTDFTLVYGLQPAAPFPVLALRLPGPSLGTPFSGTLTPTASFSYTASSFIRSLSPTTSAGGPQNVGITPNIIVGRAFDAAGNESPTASAVIDPARIPQGAPLAAPHTDFTAPQPNGAQLLAFRVSNAATKVSNCAPCTGGAPANPTTVTLSAEVTGSEQGATAQFATPFAQVQFYYLSSATSTWNFIGAAATPTIADNAAQTVRTVTWSVPGFDPPVALGATGPLTIVAIGVNTAGDALVTVPNTTITLTNP